MIRQAFELCRRLLRDARCLAMLSLSALIVTGCADRPEPVGQNSATFWRTEQIEAMDFVFWDHEFAGETNDLVPGAKRHLEEVALRLPHVQFPVVIEQSMLNAKPDLDRARRRTIVTLLTRIGVADAEDRVVIANPFGD